MASQQLNIRISEEEHQHLEDLASQTEGILTKQAVARLLIKHAIATGWDPLDRSGTLGVQIAAGTPSSSTSTSIPKSINSKSKKEGRKRQEYPEAFEVFWKGYQRLPEKASKQSKPLAFTAWEEACELHPADELQRAVDRQLEIQQEELRSARGFTVAMPDCFRWLRDECFVALLETHAPARREGDWI